LLTEIITQTLTRLTGDENHGTENSAARFQAGREFGLIPCRLRASTGRSEIRRLLLSRQHPYE